MNCPACRSAETRTETTRQYGLMVMRNRRCEACDAHWSTQETVVTGSLSAAETRPPAHASNLVDGLPVDRGQSTGGLSVDRLGDRGSVSGSLFPDSKPPSEDRGEKDETRVRGEPADFLEFWRLYPKRVGRALALRTWKRTKPDIALVRAALAWQVTSKQWREGFVPNPATWLNRGQWADERPGGRAAAAYNPTEPRRII